MAGRRWLVAGYNHKWVPGYPDGRRWVAGDGWQVMCGRWWVAGDGWQVMAGRWWVTGGTYQVDDPPGESEGEACVPPQADHQVQQVHLQVSQVAGDIGQVTGDNGQVTMGRRRQVFSPYRRSLGRAWSSAPRTRGRGSWGGWAH